MVEPRCVNCARRVPWLSFWGNLTATIYKIVVGVLGGSSALIADGIHSFTDVIGTSAILISRRISDRPADEDHPFGHGKAEFMGSVFIYVVLLFLSVGIFIGGVFVIISGNIAEPRIVTILAAAISVFYNVLMFRLGSCAGSKNNSPALMANAFENRTDAISSVACVLGRLRCMGGTLMWKNCSASSNPESAWCSARVPISISIARCRASWNPESPCRPWVVIRALRIPAWIPCGRSTWRGA